MRKIFSLCTFVALYCLLSINVAFATNWKLVYGNEEIKFFFDSDNICYGLKFSEQENEYIIDTTKISYYEKAIFLKDLSSTDSDYDNTVPGMNINSWIFSKTVSLDTKSCIYNNFRGYDINGKLVSHRNKKIKTEISPNSIESGVLSTVIEYAHSHHEKVVDNTYGHF